MDKVHYARPEYRLFLSEAADQMEEYRKKHAKYATDWNQLNFSFSAQPYHLSDPGVFPPEGTGDRWQPKACRYTYVIKSSSKDKYLIQAINQNGVAEYEIRQGMDKPAPVTPK